MELLFLPLLAIFLWCLTSFLDKYLVSKYFDNNQSVLIIYSALIGFPVALIIYFFNPLVINVSFIDAILITLNGMLFITYLHPYFKALQEEDTSTVVSIFQLLPVFSLFFGYVFLNEQLNFYQYLGFFLIIVGVIGFSVNIRNKIIIYNKKVLKLMIIATLILSIHYLVFKLLAINLDFWTVSFWQYIGFSIYGIVLLVCKNEYTESFAISLKTKPIILLLNIFNEILNMIALIVFSYACVLLPLGVVTVLNGLQPLFMTIIGLVFTIFFPKIIAENICKKVLKRKAIFGAVIIFGTYFIGYGI